MGASKEKIAYDEPFPTRLRSLLDERGISQQEIADFVGVKRQTIAQWKDGKTIPDINNFQKIVEFLAVPYEYMLGESDSRHKENQHLEEDLGLSDDAIFVLKNFHADDKNPLIQLSSVVSEVIASEGFVAALHCFQDCLIESNRKLMREYDYKNNERDEERINAVISYLKNMGIGVIGADTMKYHYLDRAKTLMNEAFDSVEGTMLAQQLRKIVVFMEENADNANIDNMLHNFLREEFGYVDSKKAR